MEQCTYTDGAKFPKYGFIEKKNYKNFNNESAEKLKTYLGYLSNNNFAAATNFLANNKDLVNYFFEMSDANCFVEEIRNTQITAQEEKQSIYYQNDLPEQIKTGDIIIMDKTAKWEDEV